MLGQISVAAEGDAQAVAVFLNSGGAAELEPNLSAHLIELEPKLTAGALFEGIFSGKALFVARGPKGPKALNNFGEVLRRCANLGLNTLEVITDSETAVDLGCSAGLLGWNNQIFRTEASRKPRQDMALLSSDLQVRSGLTRGLAIATSMNISRTLSITPPNIAFPLAIAEQAISMGSATGLKVQVLSGDDLVEARLEGLIQVGQASKNKPCLIRIEYRGGGDEAPIVLVGKTVTYDTGGLSIKPREGMVGMKQDKDGGCAVLGAMHALATVYRPKCNVVGLLCAAENSISECAYRPDDILTYRNGLTVEVTNTDAEGRLVLADGLIWACEVEKASVVIDIATLTGGVVTALGKAFAGLFGNRDDLCARISSLGERIGEKSWRLPLSSEYLDLMKSPVADLLNSNANRQAHPIQGAAFLSHFVTPETPWAHLDIAGTHNTEKDGGAWFKGPNAFGVRLLAELVQDLSDSPIA